MHKNVPEVAPADNSRGERAGGRPRDPQDDPDTGRGDQAGEAHQGGGRDWRLRPRRISPSAPGKADQPRACKNNIVRAVFTQVLLLAVIRQPVGCTDYVEQSGNHVITLHHQVVISYPRILEEEI